MRAAIPRKEREERENINNLLREHGGYYITTEKASQKL